MITILTIKMRYQILVLLVLFSVNILGQSTVSHVKVLDTYKISDIHSWAGDTKGISFSLLQKTVNDSISKVVGVRIVSITSEIVSTQRSAALYGNLNIGIGASQITQINKANEYLELTKSELGEIINFLNWTFQKKGVEPENDEAMLLQMHNGLTIGLIFQDSQWSYYFKMGEAEFTSKFAEGLTMLKKVNEFKTHM